MLTDPDEEQTLTHRNLKTPEMQGDDGIIIDLEKKTVRIVSYQVFGYAPSVYEVTN